MDDSLEDVLETKLVFARRLVVAGWFLLFLLFVSSNGNSLPWYSHVFFSLASAAVLPLVIFMSYETSIRMKLRLPNNTLMRWYCSPVVLIPIGGIVLWLVYR
jgi:hypothetical protein